MNQIQIENFLSKYPNIFNEPDNMFNLYNEDFGKNIYHKKEFYDETLDKIEKIPKKKGELLKHQKIISRFLSSYTLYDQLLLFHAMGSGKTCSAVGAVEKIRSEGRGFKGAIYVAKGTGLLNNFMDEIIFKCTDGRYIPENYDELTEKKKTRRKKKAIGDYYKLKTFETFAKQLSKYSDDVIKKRYSNFIIVIDEVHNVRLSSKDGINVYKQFHRLLHLINNSKILLMSGTPMNSYLVKMQYEFLKIITCL